VNHGKKAKLATSRAANCSATIKEKSELKTERGDFTILRIDNACLSETNIALQSNCDHIVSARSSTAQLGGQIFMWSRYYRHTPYNRVLPMVRLILIQVSATIK